MNELGSRWVGLLTCFALIAVPCAAQTPGEATDGDLQVVAVLLIDSSCPCNRVDGFADDVRSAFDAIERRSHERGHDFVRIAVSLDQDPFTGSAFLERFGPLDEVLAGNNWWGTGAIQYVWRDHQGEAMFPQIVVIEREVRTDSVLNMVTVSREREVARAVGVEGIKKIYDP